ncbi:LRRCC1 [Bugula neritina]|uniref:LRRCC1 n=1 Tax=Bugula neritina TaxID=10212 RepID=A0A7J7JH15_BUGNE|nr:LRRCC1 [Bugula neritina]
MALQIEAERFQSLKTAFEDLSSQQSVHEELLKSSKEKDIKNHKMIADLTQLVKDQQDKIVSLSKEKQEAVRKMQGTKSGLEQQIQNLNTKVTDHDRLKKDNLELKNQVQGQHSIISGLRKERELWSKELVQQGASLSNERGMLEAKLETLSQENKTLRTNLENEVDTVKIKTKLVLDLTETVSSLRQKLSLLERQLQDQGGELKTIEDQHQKEIENERSHSASLELEIENLVKRKEDLKAQLQSSENDLHQLKESHRSLKEKWQDKSFLISSLEDQVKQMKHSWQEKESKLTEERDKSIQAADLALQRLRISDDGFRKQLEAKELSHNNYIKELTEQYELQIAEKQHRVETVEDEMRELLMDQEQSKKKFDDKLKKFSDALQEFQKVHPG